MIYNLLILLIVISKCSFEDLDIITNHKDRDISDKYLLCRNCGSDVSSTSNIISKSSSASGYSFNDTLFDKDNVLIQVLSNDFFIKFPVITVTASDCASVDEWEEYDSWFPGYRWKPCVCPDCGAYLGWVFEPIDPQLVSPQEFYSLILTSIVGESCK